MVKKILLSILLFFIIGGLGVSWMMSSLVLAIDYQTTEKQIAGLNSGWITPYDEIIAEMGSPERFEIESVGGVKIVGNYFKNVDSIRCGVVVSHGHTSGKTAMLKYTDLFWDCGCDIVTYDHRGHGESDNTAHPSAGINEKDDHVNVTNWLKAKTGLSDKEIGWAGASWGAATVLMAGAYESEMAFIMADAPYQDWYTAIYERAVKDYGSAVDVLGPLAMQFVNMRADIDYKDASPIIATSSITEPVFLIHSQTDGSTSSQQSVNISKHLNDKSVFIHTDWGADHCKDINTRPEEYRKLFYKFLEEKVGPFGVCGQNELISMN